MLGLDKYEEFDVEVEIDAEDDVDVDADDVDVDVDVDVTGGAVASGPPRTYKNSVNYSAFALTLVRRTSTSRRSDIKTIVLCSGLGYQLEAS